MNCLYISVEIIECLSAGKVNMGSIEVPVSFVLKENVFSYRCALEG
jgi:hypothetical protein